MACAAANVAIADLLLRAGANPNAALSTQKTPLMTAARTGSAWELGGDVSAVNAGGDTALHGAAHIRSDALVRFLAEKGTELSVKNKRGETPLMVSERSIAAGSAPVYTARAPAICCAGWAPAENDGIGLPEHRRRSASVRLPARRDDVRWRWFVRYHLTAGHSETRLEETLA